MIRISTLFITLGWISVLAGCATPKDTILPQDLKPMKQIYEEHFEQQGSDLDAHRETLQSQTANPPPDATASYFPRVESDANLQDQFRAIEYRFPRLRNPDLIMFVYPHLAGPERVPIPGYVTAFPLYEKREYALPGEVPTR